MSATGVQPKRVAIVDDHPIVRVGVRLMVEEEAGLTCVGEAGSVSDAFVLVEAQSPDMVILDLWMGGNGLLWQYGQPVYYGCSN